MGSIPSLANLASWVSRYTQEQRLFSLSTPLGADALLVETVTGLESVDSNFEFNLTCLSDNAFIPLRSLTSQAVSLDILLPTGKRQIHGIVQSPSLLGSDGGFARYGLKIVPWLWLLTLSLNNRTFMDVNIEAVLGQVFQNYPMANWKLDLTQTYKARSYINQYRESDYDFITRWLKRLGLFFYFHYDADATGAQSKHQLVITDNMDSLQQNSQASVRFHRMDATEDSDTLTHWSVNRYSGIGSVSLQSWDYQKTNDTHAQLPTIANSGQHPHIAYQDVFGQYAYADAQEADEAAKLLMQSVECRNRVYHGTGSVRSFEVGQYFELTQHPVSQGQFVVLRIAHQGVNNLPADMAATLSTSRLSKEMGTYTCNISAIEYGQTKGIGQTTAGTAGTAAPYRPWFDARHWPQAQGIQSATVCGTGGEETQTDALGRVKVQFHWDSPDDTKEQASTWLRVAQAWAGDNFASQYIPRIGQEVIVDFMEGDIDRPLIVGGTYNGVQKPAWHEPGVLAGFKSKEFKGSHYAQWVLDDTSGQLRQSLQVSQAQAQLNLGYLVHQTDNERGKLRGQGFELRTAAIGVTRAQKGLYVTTHAQSKAQGHVQEAQAAKAQLEGGQQLAQAVGSAAQGIQAAGQPLAKASHDAIQATFKETTSQAGGQGTSGQAEPFQFGQPSVILSSAAELSVSSPKSIQSFAKNQQISASQAIQANAGDSYQQFAGQDIHLSTLEGGAKWYAGQGPVSIQAQHGTMNIEAQGDVKITSSKGEITIAAKTIKLIGGSSEIDLNGTNIELKTPGVIDVKGYVNFGGPSSASVAKLQWANATIHAARFVVKDEKTNKILPLQDYRAKMPDGSYQYGTSDKLGRTQAIYTAEPQEIEIEIASSQS